MSRRLAALLVATTLALGGCSALTLVYNRAPLLTWWWLDSYLEVDRAQGARLRAAIREWFDWHRAQEIPRYAALLASLRAEVAAPTSAARICAVNDEIRAHFKRALERTLPPLTELAQSLDTAQRARLARRYAESNAELREEFLEGTPEARRKRATERAEDAARELYGRLDAAQRRLIAEGIKASPYDAAVWIAEHEAGQRDTLDALERIAAAPRERRADTARAALGMLAASFTASPRAAYRDYLTALTAYNCDFIARVHASTSDKQRARAARRLADWERDLAAIAKHDSP